MIELILISLVTIQVGSLIYCVVKSKSPLETHYGVSVWMCIPVISINLLIY